jgi:NAD+ kinase
MSAVAFLLKRHQPEAVELCRTLVGALAARGVPALVIRDDVQPPPDLPVVDGEALPPDLRLLVVLGGDGTLLFAAGLVRHLHVPVLGVNLGHLGFLTTCSPDRAVEVLGAALDDALPIEERQRLRCRALRPREDGGTDVVAEREAVNEVVLSRPEKARLFELDACVDGHLVTTYKADGLIISTPTGSTAYNLAAGGPILTPGMAGVVLTPICPHTLTARPVVAPLSSRVEVRPGRNCEHLMLTVDGQWEVRLQQGDTVEVSRAEVPLRLVRAPEHTFFDLLRTKLHWGVRE